MRGKAIEENFREFQQYLQDIDHGVLLVIGVKPEKLGARVTRNFIIYRKELI